MDSSSGNCNSSDSGPTRPRPPYGLGTMSHVGYEPHASLGMTGPVGPSGLGRYS